MILVSAGSCPAWQFADFFHLVKPGSRNSPGSSITSGCHEPMRLLPWRSHLHEPNTTLISDSTPVLQGDISTDGPDLLCSYRKTVAMFLTMAFKSTLSSSWQLLNRRNVLLSFCYAEECSEDGLVRKQSGTFFLNIQIEPNNWKHPGKNSALPGFALGCNYAQGSGPRRSALCQPVSILGASQENSLLPTRLLPVLRPQAKNRL